MKNEHNKNERQVFLMSETEKKKEENKVAEMPENMKKRLAAYAEAVRGLANEMCNRKRSIWNADTYG